MSLISLVDGIARNTNLSVDERALLHSLLLKLGVVSGWATTKGDITVTTIELTDPLAPQYGGTGIANAVGSTLTLAAALSVTGGGTIALGGYTLTVPATGTVPLGTGVTKQIVYWTGTNTVAGSANFQWNQTSKLLTVIGDLIHYDTDTLYGAWLETSDLTDNRIIVYPDKDGNFALRQGFVTTKTDSYVITSADETVICNKGSAMTITLPAATGSGITYSIKNIGAGDVTVDGNSSDTIDGDTTQTLYQWDGIRIADYAANKWVVI